MSSTSSEWALEILPNLCGVLAVLVRRYYHLLGFVLYSVGLHGLFWVISLDTYLIFNISQHAFGADDIQNLFVLTTCIHQSCGCGDGTYFGYGAPTMDAIYTCGVLKIKRPSNILARLQLRVRIL